MQNNETKAAVRIPRVVSLNQAAVLAVVTLTLSKSVSMAAWVEETDGVVSFNPGDLIGPVITVAVQAAVTALGIFVFWRGIQWVKKTFGTVK